MAADGARVYVATDDPDERLYALDAAGGVECWTEGTYRADPAGGVAVAGGRVYLPASRETDLAAGTLTVLEAATGDRLADRPAELTVRGPAVVDGALYAAVRGTGGLRLVRFD